MLQVSFHRLAREELIDAAWYYEHQQVGLGTALLDAVELTTASIVNFPESAPIIRGCVRRKLVQRFPYAVLYSIQPETIRVLAVMNLKRRPLYWAGRE